MFWSKPKKTKSVTNVYDVLNKELERMHYYMNVRCKADSDAQSEAFQIIVEM